MPKIDIIPKLPDGALRVRLGWLLALGVLQAGLYAALTDLSFRFTPDSSGKEPILGVLMLLGAAFVLYLVSFALSEPNGRNPPDPANKMAYSRWSVAIVLFMTLLFRVVLWPSHPIHGSDIYRCIWDGWVSAQGVAPSLYSPAEVAAFGTDAAAPAELRRLAQLRELSPALRTIFSHIQSSEVANSYPPLSQTVFALAALLTPEQAALSTHIWVLKSLILVFDLVTVLLILGLLRELSWSPTLVLVYAWCPLVLKEFANSGHIDSLAACLLTATIYLALRANRLGYQAEDIRGETESRAFATGLFLGAATLSQLYPLILLPLFLRWWWRRLRWRLVFPAAGWLLVMGTVYGPLLFGHYSRNPLSSDAGLGHERAHIPHPAHPLEGLGLLWSGTEENDFFFKVARANVDPAAADWFVLLPSPGRAQVLRAAAAALRWVGVDIPPEAMPMFLARLAMGTTLALILVWLTVRPWPSDGRLDLVRSIFLALAWLWFLSPNQSPWYWCWAIPLVMFAPRPWLLVSGVAILYYSKSWFTQSYGDTGGHFYDQAVVPLQHLPVLLLVGWEALRRRWPRFGNANVTDPPFPRNG